VTIDLEKYYELAGTAIRVTSQSFGDINKTGSPNGREWRLPRLANNVPGSEDYMLSEVASVGTIPPMYFLTTYIKKDVLDSVCQSMSGIDFEGMSAFEKLVVCAAVSRIGWTMSSSNHLALYNLLTEEELDEEEELLKEIFIEKGYIVAARDYKSLL